MSGRCWARLMTEVGAAAVPESTDHSRQSTGTATTAAPDSAPPPVSPVVRRIAAEHSIDVSAVTGTGRRGRVTKRDIVAFIEHGGKATGTVRRDRCTPSRPIGRSPHHRRPHRPRPQAVQLSVMRRRIGEHMVRSLHTAAHCTTIVEADMSAVESARGRLSYLPYRGPGHHRCPSRASAAERDHGGRPAHRARRGASGNRGLAGRGRPDRARGAQRPRALGRGTGRAHRRPGRPRPEQAADARRGDRAAPSRSPTPAATGRCSPRRSSTSPRSRSWISRRWSSGRW